VSTITFLTSIVTIFCTLIGVLFLYSFLKCAKWAGLNVRAGKGGYVVHGDGISGVWVRKSEGWAKWWRKVRGEQEEFEIEEVDGGMSKRGFFRWNKGVGKEVERRPLLV
jgi:hypothetical protein